MPEITPRKLPRQARSRVTFDAIVEAYARILRERGAHEITTNDVAARAGVSIGTLYEFFPGRESILAVLAQRRLARLLADVEESVEAALRLDAQDAVELLVRRIVERVSADRELYRVLLREAPFLHALPETRRTREAFFALARAGSERARGRLRLPEPEADTWLIGRMLSNAVLEIAFVEDPGVDRELLVSELVRLTHRLLHGRDPERRAGGRSKRPNVRARASVRR